MAGADNLGEECGRLAGAAAAGDRAATERLLALVRPPIVRYCRARLGVRSGAPSADDVAQDVLLGLLMALPRYRATGGGFLAFAYRIASNKIADHYRYRQRRPTGALPQEPELPDPDAGPEQQALDGDGTRRVMSLLDGLTPRLREIVTLRVIVGLTVQETAEAVGSTPGAVRVGQHRALRTLRRRLEDECCDDRE